jgi:hypothetical protein
MSRVDVLRDVVSSAILQRAEDVRTLLALDPRQLRSVRDYLLEQAPELVHRLAEVLGT